MVDYAGKMALLKCLLQRTHTFLQTCQKDSPTEYRLSQSSTTLSCIIDGMI